MADNRSEVVSSSRKASRQQQRQESQQIIQQQQQQQSQSSTQIQSSQKTESSSTVVNMISTSNIQLKQKQEMSNQIQSQTQSQTTVTQKSKIQMQSSVEKQSKIGSVSESHSQIQSMNQSNIQQNQNQQNYGVNQQQKQVHQKQTLIQQNQQQQQLQQQQEQLQQKRTKEPQLETIENEDDDNNREEDLKVTGATHNGITDEENDLYFSNLIRQEQILNTENSYCLSDDVPPVSVSVVDNLVDINPDDTENESNSLIVHTDLISSSGMESPQSQPPSLVQCINVIDGHLMDEDRDRHHDDPSHDVSSISSKSCDDSCSIGQDQQSLGGDAEEEEDDDLDDEEHLNDVRKKKKKVKKTESFSVIELLDDKMKNLADKYEVMTNNPMIGPSSCELRACEKRVFEKVSVANLRRSFCDLTSQNQHDEDEFNFHLVERPKSSFSKFENVANANSTNGTNGTTQEDQDRVVRNNKNEKTGTGICKGCGQDVFVMEMVKAEKASWHKNCFRCSECKKPLSVDTYESNAGLLYCKPHFRELFQPKAVFESPEEALMRRMKKRPEVIIRENQPVELPPDVVRGSCSNQPTTAELEDLSVDVKSKFELFEHFKDTQTTEEKREPVIVKRSTSVLAKLAKYEGSMDMEGQIGISDHDLNGGAPTVVSDDDDDEQRATQKHLEEINYKMDDMRSKWESGMNSKKEEIHKHRQEELSKFRTRLCLGKNIQLKEMYEKAVESSADDVKKTTDLDDLDLKGKRNIKEMFEKGTVNNRSIDEDDEDQRETTVDRDRDVFENGVAKTSRNLFQNLDKQVVTGGGQISPLPGAPKKIAFKSPSGIIGVNDQQVEGEIVRSSDVVQDQVRSEDVGSKFRFFETFEDSQSQKQKKAFRITPPRDGQVKMDSPEREIYRDPNVVRSTDNEETKVPVGRTASKMLSVFKKLEEIAAGSDEVDAKSRRPLKQFTPPRETRIERNDSSEEEEEQSGSEYETDDEEPYENGTNGNGANQEEDQFLKEVGSLARAKNLRAKFEKWEIEENSKNQRETAKTQEDGLNGGGSIESAKALRARFEQPQQFDQPKQPKREVQVKRFVELQNNNVSMEECVMCNKRVYAMEKTEAGGKIYHKNCFKCSQCKCVLRMGNFSVNQGTLFCTPHFKQLFKIKGNYDEGFGRETGKQLWMKKQQAKLATESGESKEN